MYRNWLKKIMILGVILGLSLATFPLTCLAMQCPTIVKTNHSCCVQKASSAPVKLKAVCCQENQSQFEVNSTIKANQEISVTPIVASTPVFLPPLQVSLRTMSHDSSLPGTSSLSVSPILIL